MSPLIPPKGDEKPTPPPDETPTPPKGDEKPEKPKRTFRAQRLAGSVIHKAKEYHKGDKVPDGADLDRLKRLGLIEGHEPGDE